MKKILISIVSHDQRALVQNFINSFEKNILANSLDITICITNNLMDDVWKHDCKKFNIKTIQNVRPKGFGDNHNSAFSYFESDYFFIVNPDIEIVFSLDLDYITSQIPRNGIASPNIISNTGKKEDFMRNELSPINLLKRLIGFEKEPSEDSFDWFAGMFIITTSNYFYEISGFDTRYFMYVEDCDLCRTVKENSGVLKILSNIDVVHLAQRDSRRSLPHLLLHLKSILKYWIKSKKNFNSND